MNKIEGNFEVLMFTPSWFAMEEWTEMKLRSLQILIENTHFKTHFKTYFPPRNAKSDKLQACAFGSNAAREIAAAQRNYITAIISFIITVSR